MLPTIQIRIQTLAQKLSLQTCFTAAIFHIFSVRTLVLRFRQIGQHEDATTAASSFNEWRRVKGF